MAVAVLVLKLRMYFDNDDRQASFSPHISQETYYLIDIYVFFLHYYLKIFSQFQNDIVNNNICD